MPKSTLPSLIELHKFPFTDTPSGLFQSCSQLHSATLYRIRATVAIYESAGIPDGASALSMFSLQVSAHANAYLIIFEQSPEFLCLRDLNPTLFPARKERRCNGTVVFKTGLRPMPMQREKLPTHYFA